MAKATETTETTETVTEGPQGASISELVTAIKEQTGKDVEQQNLRATLRNLVKKGDLVHEPRTRWAFDPTDVATVVAHYNKADEPAEDSEGDEAKPAKKSKAKPAAKPAPAEDAEDDDDLELEDI